MGNGVLPNGPSYRAHPRLYPSLGEGKPFVWALWQRLEGGA